MFTMNLTATKPPTIFRRKIVVQWKHLLTLHINQKRCHTRRQSFLGATKNRPKLILIRHSSTGSTEQTNQNIIGTLNKSWILQRSLPLKNCSNQNVWCNSSTPQAIFDSKFVYSLSSWRNNNHDRATVYRTPFSLEQLSTILAARVTRLL